MIKMIALLSFFVWPCFASYSLNEMSLEEKVGQLLVVHFNGEKANEDAKVLVQNIHVGGIIYYNWSNGLHSPQQVLTLSSGLQQLASYSRVPIPLLIAVDQEGGVVTRLSQGFTLFPGNKALGMTGYPTLAEQAAFVMGKELLAVGVNMNLSPVVDINSNPRNPVIGIRSFGDSAEVVIPFARSALRGYRKAGIITSIKHFPGHGDVEVDSHNSLPIVEKSKESLKKVEFLPFIELAEEADTIMSAHILMPALDPKNCATLSKDILDILRDEIGFKGVIVSDSLVMKAVLEISGSVDEAAVLAFNAGCDLLILGGKQLIGNDEALELTVTDIQRIHHHFVDAVRNGRIHESRLDQAVERILVLKKRISLENKIKFEIASEESRELAKKIASLSIQVIENKPLPTPLYQHKIAFFAPALVKDNIQQTPFLALGKSTKSLFFHGLDPLEIESQMAHEMAKQADVLIFFSYNAWKNGGQSELIHSLLAIEKPLILISLRDSIDASLFPNANCIFTLFSPSIPSIQAAYDHMTR